MDIKTDGWKSVQIDADHNRCVEIIIYMIIWKSLQMDWERDRYV